MVTVFGIPLHHPNKVNFSLICDFWPYDHELKVHPGLVDPKSTGDIDINIIGVGLRYDRSNQNVTEQDKNQALLIVNRGS